MHFKTFAVSETLLLLEIYIVIDLKWMKTFRIDNAVQKKTNKQTSMPNFVSFSDTEKNETSFSHLTVDAVPCD